MSSLPPQPPRPPDYGDFSDVAYAPPPADVRNGMAIAALVCGILGLVMCPLLGLLGVIFGIIGIVRSRATAPLYRGRGLAIAGLVCGAVGTLLVPVLALMISIMLPSLSRAREITKRAVCASNMRGIGQGMKVYSNEYYDWFPTAAFTQTEDAAGNATAVSFIGNLSEAMTLPPDEMPRGLSNVHPSRSLFMLVTDSLCAPAQFVCPSASDRDDDLINPDGSPSRPGRDRFDFRGYNHLSYGYQLPYGRYGRPNENLDNRMVIAADKGPYFQPGAPVAGGARTPDAAKGSPGAKIAGPGSTNPQQLLMTPNTGWKPFNSPTHGGEGQNALFQDGHVAFEKKPVIGVNGDNIYTVQSDYTLLGALLGLQPADFVGPLTNTDSVIVP